MFNRGGQILRTGRVGLVECIRQQMMVPGETIKATLKGSCRMEMLRERDALRIHAQLSVFMSPVRWLWSGWAQYLAEGPTGATAPATSAINPKSVGLGGSKTDRTMQTFWKNAFLRVYNEWYKWPESTDLTGGPFPAVNLEHSWTRCRDQSVPTDAGDKEYTGTVSGAVATMQIADIIEAQKRYTAAVKREVFSYERYMELLKEMWGTSGSREVDQVPILVHQSEVGVKPRSFPAQNAAGLGQWGSLYDFSIDDFFTVTAPEHCILTYVLVVRLAPITDEIHPLANDRLNWFEQVMDAETLSVQKPEVVELRDVFPVSSSTQLGFLGAGWQWRAQNNIVDTVIVSRESFPIMDVPTTAAEARDATKNVNAFRSKALRDYVLDLYVNERSNSRASGGKSSFLIGQSGRKSGAYPSQGKIK